MTIDECVPPADHVAIVYDLARDRKGSGGLPQLDTPNRILYDPNAGRRLNLGFRSSDFRSDLRWNSESGGTLVRHDRQLGQQHQRRPHRGDLRFGTLMGNALFSTRFVTIWIATGLLLDHLRASSPRARSPRRRGAPCCPFGSLVAILALGQMLVIMVGGIDLSMAASISLLANILVGVSKGADDRLGIAVRLCRVRRSSSDSSTACWSPSSS